MRERHVNARQHDATYLASLSPEQLEARREQSYRLSRLWRERHKYEEAEKKAEKRFRFGVRESARMSRATQGYLESFSVVDEKEFLNPMFVFIYEGMPCYENLHSPLPCW